MQYKTMYNVFKISLMCIFNAVKKLSGIRFIVDALCNNFTYLHSLYTAVELHTNFVLIHFGRQPLFACVTMPNDFSLADMISKNVAFV